MAVDKKPAPAAKKSGPSNARGKLYEKSGDSVKPKNRHCPKCGPGFFLASHKNRFVCGKCGYVEMKTAAA